MKNRSQIAFLLTILLSLCIGYGAAVFKHKPDAYSGIVSGLFAYFPMTETTRPRYEVFSDLTQKQEVPCPSADDALVILGFGQSNSANMAGHRFTNDDANILNFFDGKCYVARDPMLGSLSNLGSVWLPFARQIKGTKQKIVIISSGIGGTKVEHWLNNPYIQNFYTHTVRALHSVYPNPDHAIWIQGESDSATDAALYQAQLTTWLTRVKSDFPKTQIHITGTSYCYDTENPAIIEAQKNAAKETGVHFLGVTDILRGNRFRYDTCHFSEQGMHALAALLADGIRAHLDKNQ